MIIPLIAAGWKTIHAAVIFLVGAFVPTPQDATLQIDSQEVLTATGRGNSFNFNEIGGGITGIGVTGGSIGSGDEASSGATDSSVPGTGWNPGGIGLPLAIVINVTALVGTGTYTVVAQESPDNSTWVTNSLPAVTINAVGVYVLKVFSTQPYIVLDWTIGGTSPSVTYDSYVNPNIGR